MAEYNNMRPTEMAKQMFKAAEITSHMARTFSDANGNDIMYKTMLSDCLNALALGLGEMATGIRATYILLEQVNKKLDRR